MEAGQEVCARQGKNMKRELSGSLFFLLLFIVMITKLKVFLYTLLYIVKVIVYDLIKSLEKFKK